MSSSSSGSLSVSWNMKVSPLVSVPRGEDAVLSCSFTHPEQQDYSGKITVKWLARESNALPFFSCSVKNDSSNGLSDCSGSRLRYTLKGDPRRGELSLLIRTVHLTDDGMYFCRVELDDWGNNYQKQSQLYVTGKILLKSFWITTGPPTIILAYSVFSANVIGSLTEISL